MPTHTSVISLLNYHQETDPDLHEEERFWLMVLAASVFPVTFHKATHGGGA